MASSIPNLGFDYLLIDTDTPSGEFNSNCGLGLEIELIAREPGQKVGFSHTRVSDQNQFEQVVIVIVSSVGGHSSGRIGKSSKSIAGPKKGSKYEIWRHGRRYSFCKRHRGSQGQGASYTESKREIEEEEVQREREVNRLWVEKSRSSSSSYFGLKNACMVILKDQVKSEIGNA